MAELGYVFKAEYSPRCDGLRTRGTHERGDSSTRNLEPDRGQIKIFVEALYRYAGSNGYVSIRSFYDDDSTKSFSIKAAKLKRGLNHVIELAVQEARRAANAAKIVVFSPPIAVLNNPNEWQARQVDLLLGLALSVECDKHTQSARAGLERLLGPATVVVASGGEWVDPDTGEVQPKLHLHWRLRKPADQTALDDLKRARDIAMTLVGGDPSNVPIVHPIRWPGSWHRKKAPKLCRIVALNADAEINLDTALEVLKKAAPDKAPNKAAPDKVAEGKSNWAELIELVLTAESYHEPLTRLAAKLIVSGMDDGAAVNMLQGLMESTSGPRDERWKARFNDIARAVQTAVGKYAKDGGQAKPSEGLGEWDAGEVDDSAIPPRGWLLGNVFCRGFVSSLLADGGVGKTATRYAQFLALATGLNLTGEYVFQRSRVLGISLEDDDKELRRRMRAARLHYGIEQKDLKGWLFMASPGLRAGKLLTIGKDGHLVTAGLADRSEKVIVERKIDLVSLDPFVKSHAVNENDNNAIDAVIQILTELGVKHDIAVDAPHHTNKGTPDPGNANRGRGASAMKDGARLVYTLTPMTHEEASCFGLDEATRRSLIRMDSGKVNIVPPMSEAKWFRLIGVPIGNGTELYPAGDTVQTVEPWKPPETWADIDDAMADQILTAIGEGLPDGNRYSDAPKAKERAAWKVVVKHVPSKSEKQARDMIKAWVENDVLERRKYSNPVTRKKEVFGLYLNVRH